MDWKKCIGLEIPFIYDNINGKLKIVKYNSNNRKITIIYQGNQIDTDTNNLIKSKIRNILNNSHNYKYQIGEIVNNLKILKQIKIQDGKHANRGYKYICLKDGYIGKITENHLFKGIGCPVCTNKKVLRGVNDIWTTNPELAKLLANPEDGFKYTQCSAIRLDWRCPICRNNIKNRSIYNVCEHGLSCPRCSDGISYPEKFMYNLLKQLNVDFEYQKKFDWCKYELDGKQKYGIYDFYIPSKHLIIEMDGSLGHGHKNNFGLSAQESQKIDDYKNKLATIHGLKIIRINCNYDNDNRFNFIKNNIFNSKLKNILDLTKVKWDKIDKESQNSLLKEICDFRKQTDMFTGELSKIFKLNQTTIQKYLKQGNKYGWCSYNPDKEKEKSHKKKSKKVICMETKKIYSSITEAEYTTKIKKSNISFSCRKKHNSAGKLPDGTKLHWMFLDEYEKGDNKQRIK